VTESKQRLKLRNDPVHKMHEFLDGFKQRLSLDDLRLAQRYVESELEIIVGLCVGEINEEFIASFKRAETVCRSEKCAQFRYGSEIRERFLHLPVHESAQINALEARTDHKNSAVFVDVVQLVENPEIVVASEVRLASVDHLDGHLTHPLYFSCRSGRPVLLDCFADREVGVISWHLPVREYESIGEMIEGCTEIMNGVAGDERNLDRHVSYPRNIMDWASGPRIALGADFVWTGVEKRSDRLIKVCDVLFGPFYFASDSGERV
jgi:hypothetical protein